MKALVTGGAGFVGSNLVDALLDRGDEVTIVDDLSGGRMANLTDALSRGALLHVHDVCDVQAMRDTFTTARPDAVFHLAAQVDVRSSIDDPAHDAMTNVVGTVTALEAARLVGVRRFVNTSTGGAVYGTVATIPTPESEPARPLAAYGQSKACAERYCEWARRLHGLSTVTVRYGNVYGPRQNPAADAGVIAIFCGLAARGGRPQVFGDGLQTRDYVYVGDIVEANLLAADQRAAHGAYNIGTGVESTVLDLVAAIREVTGIDPEAFRPEFHPARLGELRRSCLAVGRARADLGFVARTTLLDGIERTCAWAAREERDHRSPTPLPADGAPRVRVTFASRSPALVPRSGSVMKAS